MKRVVAGNQKASKVDQKLASDVEEDEKKVDADETQNGVYFRDRRLPFQVVEDRVLGELFRISN